MSRVRLCLACLACLGLLTQLPAQQPAEQPRAKRLENLDPAKRETLRDALKSKLDARAKRAAAGSGPGGGSQESLEKQTWKVGDVTREALVYVPKTGDGPHPVIFCFHGHGGRAEFSARKFAFHDLWPTAIVVYPQGLPTAVPTIDPEGKRSGWQKSIGDQGDRDLEFFDAMLTTLNKDHKIDVKRIYSAGHSNGGFFTYVLGAARFENFAALAPVAAGFNPRDAQHYKPLPILHVAGENDQIVGFASQQRTLEMIRKANGCAAEGKPAGKLCLEYASTKDAPVITMIHPGGHEVPDDAPQRIVEFFKTQAKK
ncbi:MAG: hypothetical protein QM811_28660 [Pirellulales bacterium]